MALQRGGGGGKASSDTGWFDDVYADEKRGKRGGGESRFTRENVTALTPYTFSAPSPALAATANPGNETSQVLAGMRLESWIDSDGNIAATTRSDGSTTGKSKEVTRRTYQMTPEEYDQLSPRERAAVDFNTMLVQAREKDLNTDYKPSEQSREKYDQAVEKMFGPNGGSENFAPETMAVLSRVGYEGEGQDLDNFLGLKTAITEKDLDRLSTSAPREGVETGGLKPNVVERMHTVSALTAGTSKLEEQMAKAHQMLQSFRASAKADRSDLAVQFGGTLSKVHTAPGYGDAPAVAGEGNIDTYFREALNQLSSPGVDPQQVFGNLDKTLVNPGEKQAFLKFIDEQTRAALAGDFKLPKGTRSADEIRQMFGMDQKTGD